MSEGLHTGDTILATIRYPRVAGNPRYVEIELEDVRAADSIRIHYDFERDGYVIEQACRFEWDADDTICDPGWEEVAFVRAWARRPPEP